jgi:3-oxoacyl-[acyl-carrier protein] reductase
MAEAHSQVALVTGGSKGLGVGIVEAYLSAGYCVETCSRSSTDQVRAWENDPEYKERFHFTTADVSKKEDAERFVKDAAKRWGRIDVLVNNAGVARDGVIALFGDDDIDTVIDLNMKGTIYVTRAASRVMLRQHSGSIVNISSIVGIVGTPDSHPGYPASKAAVRNYTKAAACRYGPQGVRVNSVHPGYLPPMLNATNAAGRQAKIAQTPLRRLGEPIEVAYGVLFLASDEASFVTGAELVIDGGYIAQ